MICFGSEGNGCYLYGEKRQAFSWLTFRFSSCLFFSIAMREDDGCRIRIWTPKQIALHLVSSQALYHC